MQIEFIGCTSAGKSTLAKKIHQVCREQGIDVWMGDDFVLDQMRLNWVRGWLARTLFIDLICFFVCLATWRSNSEFYRFAIGILWRLPIAVSRPEKLNIARNAFKNIAINEVIRRYASDQQMILLDEGVLQIAHYLFVHVSVEPNTRELLTFIGLVPLPDLVVYLKQSDAVLIERTLTRGHKRIPDHSYPKAERFVKRAVAVFEVLGQQPRLEGRLWVVDANQNDAVSHVTTILLGSFNGNSRDVPLAREVNQPGREVSDIVPNGTCL